MIKDLITVYSTTTINEYEKLKAKEEDIQNRVNHVLAYNLAIYILENQDKIPMEIMKKFDYQTNNEEIRMEMNIISNDEIQRLKMIEEDYNRIRFDRSR